MAGAIIEHPSFGFLIQQRDEAAPSYPLHWGLFGGHVEEGEAPEDALWRELQEELEFAREMASSWSLVQQNVHTHPRHGTIEQYIYHIQTDVAVTGLTLHEGKQMRYVSRAELFDRTFGANIEQVFRDHLAGRRDQEE